MVYSASSGLPRLATVTGPVAYRNPVSNLGCGCGTASPQSVNMPPRQREGLEGPVVAPASQPMCTLTATAPPASCCNPSPLHCSCCNGSGYFNASEAYGS